MVADLESDASPPVRYLADADHSAEQARRSAARQGVRHVFWLSQRDSRLGWIGEQRRPPPPTAEAARRAWRSASPTLLPGFVADDIPAQRQHISEAAAFTEAVLEGAECEELLLREPYAGRLAQRFELLSSNYDEGDPQEIVKIEFDAVQGGGEVVAENLWMKLSWLSYAEHDASLRFRFSFGMENYEDVAADVQRQALAAALTEAVFPESAVISANRRLHGFLGKVLDSDDLMYVERIVYFNAPDGGAQMHHDVERGHAGVVYAQLSGRTAWLALSTEQLLDALQHFLTRPAAHKDLASPDLEKNALDHLIKLAADRGALAGYLNDRDNDPLERLINRNPAFVRLLIERGHGYLLNPGDVILLPQHDVAHCSWHAVYCLDDEAGEGLSFAVRYAPRQTGPGRYDAPR